MRCKAKIPIILDRNHIKSSLISISIFRSSTVFLRADKRGQHKTGRALRPLRLVMLADVFFSFSSPLSLVFLWPHDKNNSQYSYSSILINQTKIFIINNIYEFYSPSVAFVFKPSQIFKTTFFCPISLFSSIDYE